MPLLNKLKHIREHKESYHNTQVAFYQELEQRFPHIMNSDMAKVTNKLEEELHLLLCTALKYKSVKIPIKAMSRYNRSDSPTYVNVQRGEPGFYYPRSERGTTDIHYMNLQQYISDQNNMHIRYTSEDYSTKKKTKEDKMLVELSELKNPQNAPRIVPEKLDAYFKLMREVMAYRPKFLCYVSEGYSRGIGEQFITGGLRFRMLPKSMDIIPIEVKKLAKTDEGDDEYDQDEDDDMDLEPQYSYYGSSNNYRYEEKPNDMVRMLDYGRQSDQAFHKGVHRRLEIFIDNYDVIKERLELAEATKKKAYETCQDFLKQIRVHTIPFKVLNEIKK